MEYGRESTRAEMLEAGAHLHASLVSGLFKGLTAAAVAGEAGYHRQTFYRYWDTQAEYVDDLLHHLFDGGCGLPADGLDVVPRRRSQGLDRAELARDISRYDFRRMNGDPSVTLRIGLLALGALDEAHGEMVKEDQERCVDRLTRSCVDLLEAWGREPVPPMDVRDLARIHQALLIGFVIEARASGDEHGAAELHERVSEHLAHVLTREADDQGPTGS